MFPFLLPPMSVNCKFFIAQIKSTYCTPMLQILQSSPLCLT